MSVTKIAITIEDRLLQRLDRVVQSDAFPNRSRAIQAAVIEKLDRLDKNRLARECGKLDPKAEQALAEEGLTADAVRWPQY
jgi:metal-responsive CopG/Arc/MetJ family transcriptional regulator